MKHTDTERLDWLEFNASKLGIKAQWTMVTLDKNDTVTKTIEYTEIRKMIDERMEKDERMGK